MEPLQGEGGAADVGCDRFEQTLAAMDALLEGPALGAARSHAEECAVCGPVLSGWPPVRQAYVEAFEDAAERSKPELARIADQVFARIDGDRKAATPGTGGRLWALLRRHRPMLLLGTATAAVALMVLPVAERTTPRTQPVRPDAAAMRETSTPAPAAVEPVPEANVTVEEDKEAAPRAPPPEQEAVRERPAPKASSPAKRSAPRMAAAARSEPQLDALPAPVPEMRISSSRPPGNDFAASRLGSPAPPPSDPHDCEVHRLSFEASDGIVYRTSREGMTVIWIREHEGA